MRRQVVRKAKSALPVASASGTTIFTKSTSLVLKSIEISIISKSRVNKILHMDLTCFKLRCFVKIGVSEGLMSQPLIRHGVLSTLFVTNVVVDRICWIMDLWKRTVLCIVKRTTSNALHQLVPNVETLLKTYEKKNPALYN